MTKFERALDFILRPDIEGGFSDDPHDPGGPTNFGISLRFASTVGDLDADGHPDLDVDGDGDVDSEDIRKLTRHQANAVYHVLFWCPLRCEEMPFPVALQVFDAGINQGRGPAVVLLQRAARVYLDGKLGLHTMAAVSALDELPLAVRFQAERNVRYARTANFDRYGRGWFRRSAACLAEALRIEK